MKASEAYANLIERSRELAYIGASQSLAGWDQETYMPPRALEFRASQLAYWSGKSHEMFTSREFGDCLSAAEDGNSFSSDSREACNIRGWRRDYDRATKIPRKLVEDFQKATALGRGVWMRAREKGDFEIFAPSLEKIVLLRSEMAHCWGYEETPYDALLDEYEPGMKASGVHLLFAALQPDLTRMIPLAMRKQENRERKRFGGLFAVEKQKEFNRRVAEAFGFDFSAGRIDTTTHPFCSGISPGDCRITTRYEESDFTSSLYGVMHEAGHGLYEQGLPEGDFGTPIGSACSLGIHESQSRLWENCIGRTQEFWEEWFPVALEIFGDVLQGWDAGDMFAHVTAVRPFYIRVESDELTYDLHIVLRSEVEMLIFEKKLSVKEIPAYWNHRFEELVGLKVNDDREGCLQDIHWSMGGFGYFPTYTIGNLIASQLYETWMNGEAPQDKSNGRSDRHRPLLSWLRDKIHHHGRMYSSGELIKRVCGKEISPESYLGRLSGKYL